MQGRHTNGIKKFPEQTSAQRTNIVTRCGAVVEGKPTLVLIVGMKNDPNWLLGNSFPFWGRPILRRHGFMLVSGRVSIHIKDRDSGVWAPSCQEFPGEKTQKKVKQKTAGSMDGQFIPLEIFFEILKNTFWSVVSTHFKHISQIGNLPQVGVKIKKF